MALTQFLRPNNLLRDLIQLEHMLRSLCIHVGSFIDLGDCGAVRVGDLELQVLGLEVLGESVFPPVFDFPGLFFKVVIINVGE